MTLTPRPYQIAGRDFLASRRFALLADEMRVGKTPQAILAAHKLGARSVTVVCPAIAVAHWRRELPKWWPGDSLPILDIMSYDAARENHQCNEVAGRDVFIADECHFAKNPEAARTKMVYGKTGYASKSGVTWALSGTPATKHAAELWPMLRAFGVVGCTYEEFIRAYCDVNFETGRIVGTKVKRIPELKALLAKVMLRRTRKEVAPDMPEIGYEFLEIRPEGGTDLVRQKMHHLGEPAVDDYDPESRQAVAMAKVPALADEIEFAIANGLLKQTVVFGWHKEPLKRLAGLLAQRGVQGGVITGETPSGERERIQAKFKSGEYQTVIANILAAGTAIDLSAASHGYFLELDWVPGNNAQAANRLVSMDKKEPVTFDICTWPGSIDSAVQRVLLTRTQQLSKLI